MTANTATLAIPHLTDADSMRDAPAHIKALADRLEALLLLRPAGAAGIESALPVAAANVTYTKAVTFPTGRFAATPAVCVTPDVTNPADTFVSVDAVSATGFTVRYRRTTAAAVSVWWIALERGAVIR